MASVRRCEEWHNLSVNVGDDCRERRRNAGHSMREKMVLLTRTASETAPIAFLRSFYKGEQQLHGYDAEGSDSNHAAIVHVLRGCDRNTGHWEDAQKD